MAHARLNDETSVHFSEAFSCKDHFVPQNSCFITRPKTFTTLEKAIVLQVLKDLPAAADPILSEILNSKRPLTFYRHEFGKRQVNTRTFRRDSSTFAWVPTSGNLSVHLTDLFFEAAESINRDYTLQHYYLFHEMTHLFDRKMGDPSLSSEFLKFYGWKKVDFGAPYLVGGVEMRNQHWQLASVPAEEVEAFRTKILKLHGQGMTEEANRLSFEFGRKYGHPGSYSMTNPRENFAEVLTSELIDTDRMIGVPANVRQWVHRLTRTAVPL